MKILKIIFASFLLIITFSIHAQKVKIKKGFAYVDKVKYLKVEKFSPTKYFISTLEGKEFLSINIEAFGTGKYSTVINAATGKPYEIMHNYSVFKFFDIEELNKAFEIDEGRIKHLVKMMYNSKIIIEDNLSIKNTNRMIEKFSDNVSEKLNKSKDTTIIIKNEQDNNGSGVNIKIEN